jgi:hypothetical protein
MPRLAVFALRGLLRASPDAPLSARLDRWAKPADGDRKRRGSGFGEHHLPDVDVSGAKASLAQPPSRGEPGNSSANDRDPQASSAVLGRARQAGYRMLRRAASARALA